MVVRWTNRTHKGNIHPQIGAHSHTHTHAHTNTCKAECILYHKLGCWGLTWTYQKLENWRIGTLEAPRQLPTTSERSVSLLSVAWKA